MHDGDINGVVKSLSDGAARNRLHDRARCAWHWITTHAPEGFRFRLRDPGAVADLRERLAASTCPTARWPASSAPTWCTAAYIDAGCDLWCDLVQTNTFVASPVHVSGSIGPSPGAIEADAGDTTFGIPDVQVREAHRLVAGKLASA